MIVWTTSLDVNKITTYHTEAHLKDSDIKVSRIRSTEEYKKVRASIISEGQRDPVIAMCTPERYCMVEIGEQRVLIARELNLLTLEAIVYSSRQLHVSIKDYTQLKSLDDLKRFNQGCPAIKVIIKYIKSGIACF